MVGIAVANIRSADRRDMQQQQQQWQYLVAVCRVVPSCSSCRPISRQVVAGGVGSPIYRCGGLL